MRLHHLSLTAFGPFAGTVEVDFDDLSSAGLFLLTGDTGAGKSSILDAVCFALYGEVPGDRHTAKHLRSDHAAPEAEPRAQLRFSVGERTFRITRSPTWLRPKRRGAGTTRAQAHVVAEELRDGEWVALTNRLDEAGHLVTGLLGMSCTQFTQVAMLPQGRFQAFLRASSEERQRVLQRLFRTSRFEDVERWLVDRRVGLHRLSQQGHDQVSGVVTRLLEAAGCEAPEGWDLLDLAPLAEGDLREWAEALSAAAAAGAQEHRQQEEAARADAEQAAADLDGARSLAETRARGERAARTVAELDRTESEEHLLVQSLDAHRRATPVRPATVRAENAARASADAVAAARAPLAAAAALLATDAAAIDLGALSDAINAARERRAVAEAWLPREAQLTDERDRRAALAADVTRLAAETDEGEREAARLRAARQALSEPLAAARALAARRSDDQVAAARTTLGLDAARQAAELSAQLTEARARLERATGVAQDLREVYQDLREQRISGMAAELATGLAVGCSCPVCGSADHPSPAHATSRVSRQDEDAARSAWEAAGFERQTVQEQVTSLQTQLAGELGRSGGHRVEHWLREHESAAVALAESTRAGEDVTRLQLEVEELDARERDLVAGLSASRATLAERSGQLEEATTRVARLAEELAALLADHPEADTVTRLLSLQDEALRVLGAAHDALTRRRQAAEDLRQAMESARLAATEAGFADPEGALAALLPEPAAADRAHRLEQRRAARAAADAVLAEDGTSAALDAPAPDLGALTERHSVAAAALRSAHVLAERSERRAERLGTLREELVRALDSWEPVRREHATVAGLAALAEGRSSDNQLRMPLSAYVLSERLRQVVAAANERLGSMTDQRFTLEQADEKGAGERRGGLSLRVRDEWSGTRRDPATLSGGETFLVSLALALGLADTVSHEAGGTQLDTLFIDEGFGALDATTLDGVMDVLDGLRDGGRVVGLVSHVGELRSRITAQLRVHKGRRGSTLQPAH